MECETETMGGRKKYEFIRIETYSFAIENKNIPTLSDVDIILNGGHFIIN